MKIINPTDDELNCAFAERVTGMELHFTSTGAICYLAYIPFGRSLDLIPSFTTSADAVLPWLEDYDWTSRSVGMSGMPEGRSHPHFIVSVREKPRVNPDGSNNFSVRHEAFGHSLPEACVIALLRAHGVEIILDATKK